MPAFAAQGVEVVSVLSSQKTATQIATRLVDTSSGMSLFVPSNPNDPEAPSFRIRVDQAGAGIPTLPEQIGEFDLGMEDNLGTYENRPLPAANQPPGATAVYAGGLLVQSGVVLSTGMVSTDDYDGILPPGYGAGVEGPNNGIGGIGNLCPGELSFMWDAPSDFDFNQASPPGRDAIPGDAAVITFVVDLPDPGFIRIKFVFGSDEHPAQPVETKDDGFLVFVDGQSICTLRGEFPTQPGEIVTEPFALARLRSCGPPIFLENLVVRWPEEFLNSDHGAVSTTLHFNHEFAGFTPVLTRETGDCPDTPALETLPLPAGRHTIKIVIQDVHDVAVDSAVFIPDNGITYFPILPGDFTLDGFVDVSDFNVWNTNKFQTGKKFTEGDANFDGVVDVSDFNIWNTHKFTGDGSQAVLAADFDGDGDVDCADYVIWQKFAGLQRCASRFEGDATGDGAVDAADLVIWEALSGMTAGDCND